LARSDRLQQIDWRGHPIQKNRTVSRPNCIACQASEDFEGFRSATTYSALLDDYKDADAQIVRLLGNREDER
jgi:hypothetical protein